MPTASDHPGRLQAKAQQKARAIEGVDGDGVGLKANLGLMQGCTIIVGCVIGSGIFVSPGGVLLQTGSVNMALSVWILSGLFSMIGAFCYLELGLMIPRSGGDYAYILETFGPFMGFLRLWVECIIVRPCTITIVALTFANYALKIAFPSCAPPDEGVRLLAALCICKFVFFLNFRVNFEIYNLGILAFVNCYEVKWATFIQV